MPPRPDPTEEHTALVRLVRDEGARVLATLVRTTGSLPLAEDAVQDAVMRALERWPRDGVPPEPRAWLTVTARRRAIDLIRREALRPIKEIVAFEPREPPEEPAPDETVLRDDLLRLLFICCHPALSLETQTALALRALGGLTNEEVASSLLVSPSMLLRELLPDQVPVLGLAALLELHDARTPARLDAEGEPVRLAEQDRSRWDREAVARGMTLLGLALRGSPRRPDRYVVQAAIAACHDLAPTWEQTNWAAIVSWYDVLLTVHDTPVVRLGRAIALGELSGPEAGLAALQSVEGLAHHLPFVAARAELLARCGRLREAREAYRRALELPTNRATRRTLAARLGELG